MTAEAPITTQDQSRGQLIRAALVILGVSLVLAAVSFAVHQRSINEDKKLGDAKRLAQQHEAHASQDESAQEAAYREQQKQIAQILSDSLAKNPSDTSIYLALGSARIATGDTLGAVDVYQRYLKVNPENLAAQTDYAYLLFESGKRAEGRERTIKVVKKQPGNQIALYNLAAMSYKENKREEAISWMQQCFEADSSSQIAMMARQALEQLKSGK